MAISKYTDIDIAAATICAEAGGEPWAGKVMVGEVIANRAIKSGMSIRSVCFAPRQFSCWNNRLNTIRIIESMKRSPAWADCVMVATSICQPGYTPVSPATHYFNPTLANPKWAKVMELVSIVGNHRFYKGAV